MSDRAVPAAVPIQPSQAKEFAAGEAIFREGEPSERVGLIVRGRVRVTKEVDAEQFELGRIVAGQFVGEMGVIQQRVRNATVTAEIPTLVEFFEIESFLSRISGDRDLALQTLLRLCERLHAADDRIVALHNSKRHSTAMIRQVPTSTEAAPQRARLVTTQQTGGKEGGIVALRIFAGSERTAIEVPEEGLIVGRFPFTVGRRVEDGEPSPSFEIDLAIRDVKPYRLSRLHFSILETDAGVVVSDTTSTLGTRVNGEVVGEDFPQVRAALKKGENTVIAGGEHSDFVFRIVIA